MVCYGHGDDGPKDGLPVGQRRFAEVLVCVAPVGVPHGLPEADEDWVVGCGYALHGGADCGHGVEELEQFAEVFGVGDNGAFVVGGDPPGSVAVDHWSMCASYRTLSIGPGDLCYLTTRQISDRNRV